MPLAHFTVDNNYCATERVRDNRLENCPVKTKNKSHNHPKFYIPNNNM